MSPRVWQDRLRDILEAIDEILDFTADMDSDEFAADAKTRKAVLADFAIIGEATRHVPKELSSDHPDVPWRSMRDMRNLVVHGYFQVEPAIVWETIRTDLPKLALQLRRILELKSEG